MNLSTRTAVGFLAVLTFGTGTAQQFPTRPVTLLVPFTAGGPTDTVARSLGAAMGKQLGQTFVIENVAGAAHAAKLKVEIDRREPIIRQAGAHAD